MIRSSAATVAVAIVVLVTGVIAGSLRLVYVSIGISVLAAVLLAVGAYLARQEIFGTADHAEPAPPSARPAGQPGEVVRAGGPASSGRDDEGGPRDLRGDRRLAAATTAGAPPGPARPRGRGEHALPNGNGAGQPGAPGRDRPAGPTLLGAGAGQDPDSKPGGTQDAGPSRSPGKAAAPTDAVGASGPSRPGKTAQPPKPKAEQPATGQPATGQPASEQSATEQPATGQPATGQPAIRKPIASTAAAAGAPAAAAREAPTAGTGDEPEPPADDQRDVPGGQVTIVPGVPRYHRRECILIRFLSDDDLETATRRAAEDSGCVPCKACQPDKVPTA